MGNLTSCIKFSLLRSLWRSQIQLAQGAPLFLASKNFEILPQGLACLALSDQSSSISKEPELCFPDLPEEILDRIRACLPLSAYVRSSLVSKLWKQNTFSRRLLDLCFEMRTSESWLFALSIEPTDICSYALDSEFCRWRKVGVSGMPRDCGYPVAAAGGLLCVNTYAENQVLLVLNPLMATIKELPRRNVNRPDPVVGIEVDVQSSSFKVIAVGSFEAEAVTEVFDSITNLWTITARLPMQRKLAFSCSLFSGGHFYCWTAGPPEALLVYDMQQGTWSEIPMVVPSSYAYGKLVEHDGRILLVGITHGTDTFKSIRIWELQKPGMEMHEIARMPYGIFKDFCRKGGKGSLVDQIVSSGNLLYLYSKRNTKLVVCNLTKRPPLWHQLAPSNPVGIDKGRIYLFSFCVHAKFISSIWNTER